MTPRSIIHKAKGALKWGAYLLGGILTFLAIVWFGVDVSPTTIIEIRKDVVPLSTYEGIGPIRDSLLRIAGENKEMPEDFELSILIALSHFPELMNVPIEFRMTSTGAPMESSFNIPTLLVPGGKRSYIIYLLDKEGTFMDPIIMKNLSLDLQVAMIAHELSHTIYYQELNTIEILKWGMQYLLGKQFAGTHERNTDLLTIYKGFGWQLYDYAYYVRYTSELKDYYALDEGKWIDDFYLTDKEVLKAMFQLDSYYVNTRVIEGMSRNY